MCVVMYGGLSVVWLLTRVIGIEDSSLLQLVILMVSWSSMSVGLQLLNKSLVTCLDSPAVISVVQMVIAAMVFAPGFIPELRTVPRSQLRRWCIIPVFFAAMITTSFYATEYMTLTLLTIVRNLSPLVSWPLETAMMPADQRPDLSSQAMVAILIMFVGAMTYGGTNLQSISFIGILYALVNMVLAVGQSLMQRRLLTTECRDLSTGMATFINNALGLLPTLMLAQMTGQISDMRGPAHEATWRDPKVLVLLFASGLVGIGMCWLGLECQRVMSVTSFIVVQNASRVFVILAGVALFGDPLTSFVSVLGLATSLVGSWMYGAAQMAAREKKTAAGQAKGQGSKQCLS